MNDQLRIVERLRRGETYTSLEAAKKLDMPKFTSRVSDARRMGYKILDKWEPSSDGRRPHKRYFMKPEEEDGKTESVSDIH